jgi:rSAM/selenodomain-associated transferase 1
LRIFWEPIPRGLLCATTLPVRATETRIIVFARAPEAGCAKTRLIPLLGAAGAAQLQACMIERTLKTALAASVGPVELRCEPSAEHPLMEVFVRRHSIVGTTQCDGDLGERMQHAAESGLASAGRVLLIGTDCPAMTPADLRAADAALSSNDAVLIPADDGGYVLLGLNRSDIRLFSNIAWGGDQVLARTRERLSALGWRWLELPPLWDVDRPDDFVRLAVSGLMPELAGKVAQRAAF